jgi:hypothetical protein
MAYSLIATVEFINILTQIEQVCYCPDYEAFFADFKISKSFDQPIQIQRVYFS